MARLKIRTIVSVALVVAMCATGVAFAYPDSYTSVVLATGSASQINARIDGEWVVYQVSTPLVIGSKTSITLLNLHNGTSTTIGAGDDANQRNADVSAGEVVYEDDTAGNTDIYTTAYGWPIASTAANETMPHISGNLIAWYNEGDDRVHYRDSHTTGIVPDSANITYLDVDRGRIFWSDALVTQNVHVFEPGIDTASKTVYTAPAGNDLWSLCAYGDYGAVTRDDAGTSYAQRFGTEALSTWSRSNASQPSLFHESVAVQVGPTDVDVLWYATDHMGSINVGVSADEEKVPSVFGNTVVYSREVAALNNDIYIATATPNVMRTAGTDRYKTAVAASKAYFKAADAAVLCTGENFPDALAAVPFARVLGGPLLLCRKTSASAETISELDRLGVKDVYIIGSTGVVSDAVKTQLEHAGYTTHRIWGTDRYATSAAIAMEMNNHLQPGHKIDGAFFANGSNFPDALALGPVAAGAMWPILLVRQDALPTAVYQVIEGMDDGGAIAGGTNVVSESVRNDIIGAMSMAPNVERWDGTDRYGTAVEVVKGGLEHHWIDLDTLGIATGANFPDALGGGAALGHYGSPLLLVGSTSVPPGVSGYLTGIRHSIGRVDVFGGTTVVSDGVKNSIENALP